MKVKKENIPPWNATLARGTLIMIACMAVLVTACSPTLPSWWPGGRIPCPEDAARAMVRCPGATMQIHAVHDFPDGGRLLLYSGTCPPSPEQPHPRPVRGHVLFEPENDAFRQAGTARFDNATPIPFDAFLTYISGGVSTKTEIYSYVYGRVLSSEVRTVEALFDTREVVQDEVSDGIYGVIAAGSKGVCEMRVLGEDGHILVTTTMPIDDFRTDIPREDIRPGGIDGWDGIADPKTCAALDW